MSPLDFAEFHLKLSLKNLKSEQDYQPLKNTRPKNVGDFPFNTEWSHLVALSRLSLKVDEARRNVKRLTPT